MQAGDRNLASTISTSLPDLEPGKATHGGPSSGEQLLDGLLRVPHRWLLDQDDVLEERIQPAFNDLRDRLLRLAFVTGHLLGDAPLVRDDLLRDLVPGDVLRSHRGDLVRDVERDVSS